MENPGLEVDEATETPSDEGQQETDPKKRVDLWRDRLAASKRFREDLIRANWRENVNYRMQQPFGAGEDGVNGNDKLSLPEDWARTKQKAAQLMFLVPKIVAKAGRPELGPVAPVVTAAINDVLTKECEAQFALDECLADVINAAGVMAAVVGIDHRTETYEIDGPPVVVDPGGAALPDGTLSQPTLGPGPKQTVSRVVSQKFTLDRISPAHLLWPVEFKGSNWDKAPWLGYDTWLTKTDVMRQWGQQIPEGEDPTTSDPTDELLSKDLQDRTTKANTNDYVKVTVVWARGSEFDETIVNPECFKRIVFVDGIKEPVEDGKTDWQEWVPEQPEQPGDVDPQTGQPGEPIPAVPGHYVGIRRNPIRISTLTYISDMAIPPSDSQAGRPQVREMIRGRSQMLRQRDHSIPLRWFDVNRVDDEIATSIQHGTWQGMIPMNGPGQNAIGEVARASYPRENFEFQSVVTNDLDRAWSLSNNQLGSATKGKKSATEISTIQASSDIRLDYEKARVSRFVVGIADVLFGLMQKFMEYPRYVQIVGQEGADVLRKVDRAMLAGEFSFDFLADSSDRVDIDTRRGNALALYNLLSNSPGINRQALEREIVELHGFDPTKIIGKPPEPAPEKPNVSYRFSGEDMLNPIAVAVLLKTGEIMPEDIKAAATLIQDAIKQAQSPQTLPNAQGGPGPGPGAPPKVEPPKPAERILKRLDDGTRMP